MNEAQRNERHAPVNHCAVSFPHTEASQHHADAIGVMFAETCGALAQFRAKPTPENKVWVETSVRQLVGAVSFSCIVGSRMAHPSFTNTNARANATLAQVHKIAHEIGAMPKGNH